MKEDPKTVASRFYDILNDWSSQNVDGVFAPDVRGHAGAGETLADFKSAFEGFRTAFPDLRVEIRHLVREGDLVSSWLSWHGTHQAEFAGVPATGRAVRFAAWDLLRIEGGRIVEITQYCDLFTILNQIGALPTAAPA